MDRCGSTELYCVFGSGSIDPTQSEELQTSGDALGPEVEDVNIVKEAAVKWWIHETRLVRIQQPLESPDGPHRYITVYPLKLAGSVSTRPVLWASNSEDLVRSSTSNTVKV